MENLSNSSAISQASTTVEAELREAAARFAAFPRVIDATQFDYENLCAGDVVLYAFELEDGDRVAASSAGSSGVPAVDLADARGALPEGEWAGEGLPFGPALEHVQRCVLALLENVLSHTGVARNCQRWRVAQETQSRDEVMLARAQRVPFASTLFAPRLLDITPGTRTDRKQNIIRRADALRHAEWPALQAERIAAHAALATLKRAAERDPAHADAAFHAELTKMKGLLDACGELVDLFGGAIPPQAGPDVSATDPDKLEVLWCPPATTRRSWMMRRRHCVVVG
ncbi:hypothetical protein [Bordetella sp. LUAb4]|uniref:hypothetical protein n=1 Tax=Bordetella sp. LUAb4 TaxID=2843195 RepID=UPI001E36DC32|nr:hypothetical protein [Bordetella sp. LUAb4]